MRDRNHHTYIYVEKEENFKEIHIFLEFCISKYVSMAILFWSWIRMVQAYMYMYICITQSIKVIDVDFKHVLHIIYTQHVLLLNYALNSFFV